MIKIVYYQLYHFKAYYYHINQEYVAYIQVSISFASIPHNVVNIKRLFILQTDETQ